MGKRKSIIVIGAGAAGLMAACAAADEGADVTVIEKNEKAGKKIYITGKGRCNFTNACDTADYFRNVISNPKFLYSAVYDFDQQAMIRFLEDNGCPTKVERGNRAFPLSDHASDVTRALTDHLRKHGGKILFHQTVTRILTEPVPDGDPHDDTQDRPESAGIPGEEKRRAVGVELPNGRKLRADAVILATGGRSYPSTGSTGDGYRFAGELGMEVREQSPSLVPFTVRESWPMTLQGLSLKNVAVKVLPAEDTDTGEKGKRRGGSRLRPVYEGFGEMLFTHFGVSGPLILSASCHTDFREHPEGYDLHLDLKPALSMDQLTARIQREFELAPQKEFVNAIRPLFPARLSDVMAQLSGLAAAADGTPRKAVSVTVKEIQAFAALVKDVPVTLTGTRGFNEAIITRGGICVKEINPSSMESRRVQGLYIAGEVIDVDAYTGGFNLQIAWSTGHLAGVSAAET